MTPKQLRFVDAYLIAASGKEAAIRAGYSPGSAHVKASQNLRKPAIAAAIRERQKALAARNCIDQDTAVSGLLEAHRKAGNVIEEVQAVRELARVCGLYPAQKVR